AALYLGVLAEKMRVRSFEPLVRRDRARQAGTLKGGAALKKKPGIWEAVQKLVAQDPKITAEQAWNRFPESTLTGRDDEMEGFLVYRDGDKLVQLDCRTGHETDVARRSFTRYVTAAKRKLVTPSATSARTK